ncbi:universal stress protein [Niastella populi]|uniref:UspA domain-containing protein n=1 Tax=Niastella populi TaxID=550983 RepID=A0A1V9ES66_9BACT|nr:universal stress protein [Niastella populi]OQP48921.1 hypothetical protein A4R26_31250 [Niastella populi]
MKRVLVAIDARQVNINVLDFACYIAKLTHSKLTGVFLDTEVQEPVSQPVYSEPGAAVIGEKQELFGESVRVFRDACTNRGANCSVFNEITILPADIIKETRFAELLIVDPDMSFKDRKEEIPSSFIREVLVKSECPVVLAPFSFYGIDEIVFAYDDGAAAAYAIKQFTYLFPEFTGKKITVLQVDETGENLFKGKDKMGELLQLHYQGTGFRLLQGKAADELFGYLLGKKNIFVVMGAFGRGMISGLVRHSTAELLIKTINLPVFIAHHK